MLVSDEIIMEQREQLSPASGQAHSATKDQENGEPSLESQPIVLNSSTLSAEEYEFIFAAFANVPNSTEVHGDKLQEFTSETYTIQIQGTPDEICEEQILYIEEDSRVAVGRKQDTETLTRQDLILVTDVESARNEEYIIQSEDVESARSEEYIIQSEDVETARSEEYIIQSEDAESARNEANISGDEDSQNLETGLNDDKVSEDYIVLQESDIDEVEREKTIELDELSAIAAHGLDTTLPIACDICNTEFQDMSEFDYHMRHHVETRLFMCQLCTNTYQSWQNLVAHRKVCHEGKVITCNDCSVRKIHYNLNPISFPVGDFSIGCEECLAGFKSVGDLNRHYRSHMLDTPNLGNTQKGSEENCSEKPEETDTSVKKDKGKEKKVMTNNTKDCNKVKELIPLSKRIMATHYFMSKCNICQKELGSFKLYYSHRREHSDITVQCICPFCEKLFNDMEKYKSHLAIHIHEKQYQCTVCFRKFNTKSALNTHTYSHPITEKYRCFNCQIDYVLPQDMLQHIAKVHNQSPDANLICDICTENYPVPKFMEHYLICHANLKCRKAVKHIESITCKICDKVFSQSSALRRHMKTHSSTKHPHLCEVCGMLIYQTGSFIPHIRSHGRDFKENQADLDKTFLENVNNDNATNFICEVCGKVLKSKKQLKLHVLRHTGIKPYSCSNCTATFYTRTQLTVHMRRHTGERPYECGVCKKTFASSGVYHAHQRLHKSIKQHVCPICEKTFLWRSAYHNHMRMHSAIRPYKCDVSSKTFSCNSKLIAHKNVQDKKKVKVLIHQCVDCGQSFASAIELQNHHEEKCYLTMMKFLPSDSVENKESSPHVFLNANSTSTPFSEKQHSLF